MHSRLLAGSLVALILIAAAAAWRWKSQHSADPPPPAGANATRRAPGELQGSALEPRPESMAERRPHIADPWFQTVRDAGISFVHESGASPEKPFPAANGSGIAALDYDLDGCFDLYFATGTMFPIDPERTEPADCFYRNHGSWEFRGVSRQSGLTHAGYSAGVTCGDYNSDGFPDIYVACYGANVLYTNMGDGTFQPLHPAQGAADDRWATSAAMFDYDADGLLDIYVCNYGKWTLEDNRWCGNHELNLRYYCSPQSIEPEVDALLHNLGDDRFEDSAEAAGLAGRAARAQGVIAADLDGNGAIDLYVGNDLHANSLFLNDGGGRFRDATEASGVAYDYLGTMQAGMGVDAEDVNGDGRPELFVTNFENEHNAHYENMGDGIFQEVSQQRGLYTDSLPWVGWGAAFADFNLDGWLDLVVTNGHVDDNRPNTPYAEPSLLWAGKGGHFAFLGAQAGEYFTERHVGRALAVVDLDNDGDQDVVIGNQDSPPALLRNEYRGDQGRSLGLRLIGAACNRDAIGSKITLRAGDHVQALQVKGGGSYLSAHDCRKVFAVPAGAAAATVEIHWADGAESVIDDLAPGAAYTVIQPMSPSDRAHVYYSHKGVSDD